MSLYSFACLRLLCVILLDSRKTYFSFFSSSSPSTTNHNLAWAQTNDHRAHDDLLVKKAFSLESHQAAMDIRDSFYPMMYSGQSEQLLQKFEQIQLLYETLYVDDDYPSLYGLQGVLYFYMNRRQEAYEALRRAVFINPNDLRSLVNLVDVGLTFQRLTDNDETMAIVEKLTGRQGRLKKSNAANWENLEFDQYVDTKRLQRCVYEHRNEDLCDFDLINVNLLLFPPPLWRTYLEFSSNCSMNDMDKYVDVSTLYNMRSSSSSSSSSSLAIEASTAVDNNTKNESSQNEHDNDGQKSMLRIGMLLVTNDLNPVNILLYALIKHLPRHRIQLYGFFLNAAESVVIFDWQKDFLHSFDEVINLDGLDRLGAYHMIHDQYQIDILIELNGMSLNTGVATLMLRPAPIQMSFLGDPVTSGLSYIDYFLGDPHSISVESMIDGFSEKLLLLPTCYLVNSHAISQRHIPGKGRIPRDVFVTKYLGYPNQRLGVVLQAAGDDNSSEEMTSITAIAHNHDPNHIQDFVVTEATREPESVNIEVDALNLEKDKMVFHPSIDNTASNITTQNDHQDDTNTPLFVGAFHGWSKIDPAIFHVWMNILQQSPRDILLLQSYSTVGFGNLKDQMHYYGINPKLRASYISITPFQEHLYVKSAIDLYLDTILKNGHTTTMDAHWSGLPTVALGGTHAMMSRSSLSAAYYNENDFGIVYSLKEYEDFVLTLIKSKEGRRLLQEWRKYTEKQRLEGKLFNTHYFANEFSYLLEAIYELHHLKNKKKFPNSSPNDAESNFDKRKYHFFAYDSRPYKPLTL